MSPEKKRRSSRLSLHGLTLEEALKGAMGAKWRAQKSGEDDTARGGQQKDPPDVHSTGNDRPDDQK